MLKMDAYKLHLLRSALGSFADSVIWTAMMLYQINVVGLTPFELVMIGTTMEATIFIFEIPTGIVADVYSRRLSVLIGAFLTAAAYLLMGLVPAFGALLLGQVIWGFGYTFGSGAYEAWLVDEIGQERAGNAFIRGGQAGNAARLLGIGVSVLMGSIALHWPILLGAFFHLLVALVLVVWMPETGFTPTPRPERSTFQKMFDTFSEGLQVIRRRPTLMSILGIGLFIGLYSEAWDRLWQFHLLESIGLPTFANLQPVAWFGLFEIIGIVIGLGASEVLRRRLDMNNVAAMRRALFTIVAVMVGGLIVYGLSQTFIVAIFAYFVFTTMRGLSGPIFGTWSNEQIDSNVRATVLSVQSQTDAIGQIAGGPPLGALGQLSLRAAFFGSAALLSPVLWLLNRVGNREKQLPIVEVAEA